MGSTGVASAGKFAAAVLVFLGQGAILPISAQISHLPLHAQLDANRLAREVMQNEIQAEINDESLWCYRQQKEEQGRKKLFAVCETKEGEIDRLLEVNGQELNTTQRQAEDQRIQKFLSDPSQMRQQRKKGQDDAKQERDVLRMFPDAFRFQYDGTEGNLVRLKFTPNPDFRGSGRAAQVFRHMEGSMLVDPEQKRLAEITGELTSEVRFGWGGILGHLDEGGTFFVKQQDLGSGHWELAKLDVEMNGKALLFKTIAVREKEINTDFQHEPDGIKPQQAFELLRREPEFRNCPGGNCSKAQGAR